MRKQGLLLYCQHSVGLGHLVRSFALGEALSARFRVVLLSGGAVPAGIHPPAGVELVALPPLGAGLDGSVVSGDHAVTVDAAQRARRRLIVRTFERVRPAVLTIELFPFGRKKFANELLPLLEAAHARPGRPLVLSSLRDILVTLRRDQHVHDERAVHLANRWFDAVLVHADPRFARLEESFRPHTPIQVPVHYTGFVVPSERPPSAVGGRSDRIVVSAGGGREGEPLLRAALDAHALLAVDGLQTTLIGGPFLADEAWAALVRESRGRAGLELHRVVPSLAAELRDAAVSVSQCGYNTALEVVRARVPAVVVPFAEGREDEQTRRAARLERLGLVRVLEATELDGERLAAAVRERIASTPRPVDLDFGGGPATAVLLDRLLSERTAAAS